MKTTTPPIASKAKRIPTTTSTITVAGVPVSFDVGLPRPVEIEVVGVGASVGVAVAAAATLIFDEIEIADGAPPSEADAARTVTVPTSRTVGVKGTLNVPLSSGVTVVTRR